MDSEPSASPLLPDPQTTHLQHQQRRHAGPEHKFLGQRRHHQVSHKHQPHRSSTPPFSALLSPSERPSSSSGPQPSGGVVPAAVAPRRAEIEGAGQAERTGGVAAPDGLSDH
jgi:hypothetical protein